MYCREGLSSIPTSVEQFLGNSARVQAQKSRGWQTSTLWDLDPILYPEGWLRQLSTL